MLDRNLPVATNTTNAALVDTTDLMQQQDISCATPVQSNDHAYVLNQNTSDNSLKCVDDSDQLPPPVQLGLIPDAPNDLIPVDCNALAPVACESNADMNILDHVLVDDNRVIEVEGHVDPRVSWAD